MNQSVVAADTFSNMTNGADNGVKEKDLPFAPRYLVDESMITPNVTPLPDLFRRDDEGNLIKHGYHESTSDLVRHYRNGEYAWRKIDHDWLGGVGSLALRLNSHINNTSLAMAIEFEQTGDVLLLPGDAEYGSWESWHLIKQWDKKGKGGKHLVEDLLGRTVFYKVGHHLSYNGTALEKGISMMPGNGMASMVTLDRTRISENWKSTMPNKLLLQDLIKRCDGKVFVMDEDQIKDAPSKFLDPHSLGKSKYEEGFSTGKKKVLLYKQYTLTI
jgi:hypothetical protein